MQRRLSAGRAVLSVRQQTALFATKSYHYCCRNMAILQRGGLRRGIRSGLPPVERKLYTVDKRGNKEVANAPSTDAKEQPDEQVNPEVLKPQEEAAPDPAVNTTTPPKPATKLRRGTYRPSHKAIFIALA